MTSAAWRCTVCGYVHRGDRPPDCCPVCGAAGSDFELSPEPAGQAPAEAAGRWQCTVCNYVHDGGEPPAACPVCGAPRDRFEPAATPAAGRGSASATEVVIVGGGIAGVSAAESARKASPDSRVTILSREEGLPYYRLNLTRYIAGDIDRGTLPIYTESWYRENGILLRTGVEVESLDRDGQVVLLSDGSEVPFESLVLATGSHPFVPQLQGTELGGVMTLRTTGDADRMLAFARRGLRCVCIGGGVLGIETAGALARRQADVTLLESHDWLMPRQLNRRAGELLKRHLAGMGVRIEFQARTREITGSGGGVCAVALHGGKVLPADLVVIATGVRPNTHLALKAGIAVNNGIVVDNRLRTSAPGVFAAGDVAEHNGIVYGVWTASQFQGGIAGLNAVGIATEFGGIPRSNTLKLLGLDLTSIGKFEPEDGSYQVIDREDPGGYAEFLFRDGKLTGSILVGHPELASVVRNAIETRRDFSGVLAESPSCDKLICILQAG